MTIEQILEAIESMTLLQVKELVDALKEKFGVTGAIAVAGGAAAAEEKSEFDVVLADAGAEKIKVVKYLQEKGTFKVKGAIVLVAEKLAVSEPTIYRYLKKM